MTPDPRSFQAGKPDTYADLCASMAGKADEITTSIDRLKAEADAYGARLAREIRFYTTSSSEPAGGEYHG